MRNPLIISMDPFLVVLRIVVAEASETRSGRVDGESGQHPAVGRDGFGRLLEPVQTQDRIPYEVRRRDEDTGQEAEGGGPVVVEAEDLAVHVGVGIAHLHQACEGARYA